MGKRSVMFADSQCMFAAFRWAHGSSVKPLSGSRRLRVMRWSSGIAAIVRALLSYSGIKIPGSTLQTSPSFETVREKTTRLARNDCARFALESRPDTQACGVSLVREAGGIYALRAVCTHQPSTCNFAYTSRQGTMVEFTMLHEGFAVPRFDMGL